MQKMGLRTYVTLELATLGILTALFLFLFPQRVLLVDVGLALFALMLLTLNAGFTTNKVWDQFPVSGSMNARLYACLLRVGLVTGGLIVVFLGMGIALGYAAQGWHAALARIANWHLIVTTLVYYPWALVQQTLFQFYLLGRFCALWPAKSAVVITGVSFWFCQVSRQLATLVVEGKIRPWGGGGGWSVRTASRPRLPSDQNVPSWATNAFAAVPASAGLMNGQGPCLTACNTPRMSSV